MGDAGQRAELVEVIRQIRNRWRLKLALRGVVVVVAGSLLALLLSASGLEALKFSAPAIIAFRILVIAVFVSLAVAWLWRPLKRQVSDAQVALYLEECDPSLEASILSAVEASGDSPDTDSRSRALVERLVQQAIEKCRTVDYGRTMEREGVRRHMMTLGAVTVAAALLVTFGPAFLRQGLSALLKVYSSAEAATPYHIEVTPGTATVPRNSDQQIKAKLVGFKATDAELRVRSNGTGAFERVPLVPGGDPQTFEGILFHLDKPIDYRVVANGVESALFTMTLVDLPTVDKLELEYRYPAYTGLPPQKIENGGDVAALRGTEVFLHIIPTMNAPSGRILLNESDSRPLTRQADGSLTGSFTIDKQGFYRIELEGPKAEHVIASPQYTIDVTADRSPTVSFLKPGRDTMATSVEELFVEAKASDDFGIKALELVYAVNGGKEKVVKLFGGKPMTDVSAGHTIYLEELGLTPGDSVSYYARATDSDSVQSKTVSSDIYFVQIRQFRKDFKPAQSQAQGGGGGGGGNDVGQLSEQQKQIVAATFNVIRDKAKLSAEKYRENVVFLTLSQGKLKTQVDELIEKMRSRQVDQDERFKKIASLLAQASPEMSSAEATLRKQDPKTAMTPEQSALKFLQAAEQEYEMQLAQQGGGGGGGGGGQQANDLADLFELELDKLANQYEMQKRAGEQQGEQKIDELANKLKELAQRQQQEAERQRRMAANGQNQSGGGQGQRQLADEVEEAARRLEQLSRDQPRQDLNDLARQLQQTADAMRRAAANGSRDGGAQAQQALDKLRQANDQLMRGQSNRTKENIQEAQRRAEALAAEQKEVENQVRGLDETTAGGPQGKKLVDQKAAMGEKLAGLEKELQQLAEATRRTERDASRKLTEASETIRSKQLKEMIDYTKRAIQARRPEVTNQFEPVISSNLDAIGRKLGEAAGALGNEQKMAAMDRALEGARNLTRGMESIDQRLKNGQQGQQGQQQGQQGKDGQQPGQGKDGQQARGQQGEGQQGKDGKGQGQQGQGQQGKDGKGQGQQGQGQQGQQGQGGQGGQGQQGQGGQGGQGQNAQGGQQGNGQQQGQQARNGGQQGQMNQPGGFNGGVAGNPTQASGAWLGGDARPNGNGVYNGDVRQLRREYQERLREAQDLQRVLGEAGVSTRELNDVIAQLRQFDNDRLFNDPRALEQLHTAALNKLKEFDFNLRKKAGADNNQLSLSGSDEVPPGFRTAIEEYYRKLAQRATK